MITKPCELPNCSAEQSADGVPVDQVFDAIFWCYQVASRLRERVSEEKIRDDRTARPAQVKALAAAFEKLKSRLREDH